MHQPIAKGVIILCLAEEDCRDRNAGRRPRSCPRGWHRGWVL